MDDNREIIECINFRAHKTNVLKNSIYLLVKTTKRRFEFNINIRVHKDFIYDLKFHGDTHYKNFINSVLYDYIVDNNIITFYTNVGKFSIESIKAERVHYPIPRLNIKENGKEIWNKEIG